MITKLAISGYRSLRDIALALGPVNVVTGPNGSGKSSLYRALRLLADVAQGRIIQALAAEGGLVSTLWAGPETFARAVKRGEHPVEGTVRKRPVSLKLGFAGKDYGYAIDLGFLRPRPRRFHATRRSNAKAYGPARPWDERTPSRFGTGRACAFAMTAGRGGRLTIAWRRSTA
jgi:predicted ATPase